MFCLNRRPRLELSDNACFATFMELMGGFHCAFIKLDNYIHRKMCVLTFFFSYFYEHSKLLDNSGYVKFHNE